MRLLEFERTKWAGWAAGPPPQAGFLKLESSKTRETLPSGFQLYFREAWLFQNLERARLICAYAGTKSGYGSYHTGMSDLAAGRSVLPASSFRSHGARALIHHARLSVRGCAAVFMSPLTVAYNPILYPHKPPFLACLLSPRSIQVRSCWREAHVLELVATLA